MALSLSSLMTLVGALEQDQLLVAYQPIFDVRRHRIASAEALLRWQHPERGVLTAGAFLPADLPRGLAKAITTFVMTDCIRRGAAWSRAGRDIAVCINVPPSLLVDDTVPDLVASLTGVHELEPHRLMVEITEEPSLGDVARMRPACVALSRLGVRLSLDDFGCGESSLTRLKQLHVDEIKIDRTFVMDSMSDPTARYIVEKSTELAHELGIHVVAEGVETQACFELMITLGVDRLQGFYVHRPTDADDVAALVETSSPSSDAVLVRSPLRLVPAPADRGHPLPPDDAL